MANTTIRGRFGRWCRRNRAALLAAVLGAVYFLWLYGPDVVIPTNVDWFTAIGEDPRQHYYGWVLYRRSRWMFPIGLMDTCVYPYPVSVIYSDSLPLFAVLFKLLSPLLPDQFQYWGIWGLLCYALMGFLGAKLVGFFAARPAAGETAPPSTLPADAAAVLGSVFFITAPVLKNRMYGHTALASQWLILAALCIFLYERRSFASTRRMLAAWAVMGVLCGTIHMYYLAMCGIVLLGFAVRRGIERRSVASFAAPIAAFCLSALAVILLLGGFSSSFAAKSNMFVAGIDLLDFLDPQGTSRFWAGIDTGSGFERYSWVGLGALLLALLAACGGLIRLARTSKTKESVRKGQLGAAVGAAVIVLVTLFVSLGKTATVGGHVLYTLPLPNLLLRAWSMFSSSGRIAWVLIYFGYAVLLGLAVRWFDPRAAVAVVALCAAVQGADLSRSMVSTHEKFQYLKTPQAQPVSALQDDAWEVIAQQGFAHVALTSCRNLGGYGGDFLAYAVDHHMTINTMYLAHIDREKEQDGIMATLNPLTEDTLYVLPYGDELLTPWFSLNYYRVDGLLIGTVNELPLPEYRVTPSAQPEVLVDYEALDFYKGEGCPITLEVGQSVAGPSYYMMPGNYSVILCGENLDKSYLHSYYRQRQTDTPTEVPIRFIENEPNQYLIQFVLEEKATDWEFAIHARDAAVTINSVTVRRDG